MFSFARMPQTIPNHCIQNVHILSKTQLTLSKSKDRFGQYLEQEMSLSQGLDPQVSLLAQWVSVFGERGVGW